MFFHAVSGKSVYNNLIVYLWIARVVVWVVIGTSTYL